MNRLKTVAAAALLAVPAALAGSLDADARSGIKVGVLDCRVAGGYGLVVTSKKALKCAYRSADGEHIERYRGAIRKFGVDIGSTGDGRVVWAVFAPGHYVGRGALAGRYAGASGEVSLGIGAGAHLLIGGSHRAFTLQPLSVQGQTGLNVAAGVSTMELHAR